MLRFFKNFYIQSPADGGGSANNGLLETLLEDIVKGDNPVDITELQTAETGIHALLPTETTRSVDANGKYDETSVINFALPDNATDLGDYALYYEFYHTDSPARTNSTLKTMDLSSLTQISGQKAMQYVCTNATAIESVNFANLETVSGSYALSHAFEASTLKTINLSKLKTVSSNTGMGSICYNSNLESLELPNLETLSGTYALQYAFRQTKLVNVVFPKLSTLTGSQCLGSCFRQTTTLQSLSFPALTSTSFGNNTNQFDSMLYGVTGCTVHFPSNLQSVIGSWSSVTGGFGGTNTTVSFDLTATT